VLRCIYIDTQLTTQLGYITTVYVKAGVGINLKELGAQMSKCLKVCRGIEI